MLRPWKNPTLLLSTEEETRSHDCLLVRPADMSSWSSCRKGTGKKGATRERQPMLWRDAFVSAPGKHVRDMNLPHNFQEAPDRPEGRSSSRWSLSFSAPKRFHMGRSITRSRGRHRVRLWITLMGVFFIVMSIIVLLWTLAGAYSPCFGWIDFLIFFVIGVIVIVKGLGDYD